MSKFVANLPLNKQPRLFILNNSITISNTRNMICEKIHAQTDTPSSVIPIMHEACVVITLRSGQAPNGIEKHFRKRI